MNKNIINSFIAGSAAIALAGCNENSWNDHYLDGFEDGVNYESKTNATYTLTDDDYSAISSLLKSESTTEAETNEAKAIESNLYLNKAGVWPASKALIPYLDSSSFPYYLASNGSVVDITFNEAANAPEELATLIGAKRYTVSNEDYQKVWGNSTVYIKSFAPETPAASNIPALLASTFKGDDAVADGTYAVVTYNNADQNPYFVWDDAAPATATLYSDETFKAGKYILYAENIAAKIIPTTTANGRYAYFYTTDVSVSGNVLSGYDAENNIFVFTETSTPGVYFMGDDYGHYYYGDAKYNNFYINDTAVDEDQYKWTVTKNADGTWTVKNVLAEKWVQYAANYSSWGDYNYVNGSCPVLYVPDGEVPEPTGTVVYTPTSTSQNAIYYYNNGSWSVASGVVTPNPADYTAMGVSTIEEPANYIPAFLKTRYPYAQEGDQEFVVYNAPSKDEPAFGSNLFVYTDGQWAINNVGLETVTARFQKEGGEWSFVKYIGKAIYDLFDQDQIERDRSYLLVADGTAAYPVDASKSYGYLYVNKALITNNQIVMPNDASSFIFASSFVKDGVTVSAPEGKFLLSDASGRYYYMSGTFTSANLKAEPLVTDGQIDASFLWSASRNSDGTWTIINDQGADNTRTLLYDPTHVSYGVYYNISSTHLYPTLYILAE